MPVFGKWNERYPSMDSNYSDIFENLRREKKSSLPNATPQQMEGKPAKAKNKAPVSWFPPPPLSVSEKLKIETFSIENWLPPFHECPLHLDFSPLFLRIISIFISLKSYIFSNHTALVSGYPVIRCPRMDLLAYS